MDIRILVYITLLHICLCVPRMHNFWPDVYTGRQFNDLVLEVAVSEYKLTRAAVLFVYSEECLADVVRMFKQKKFPAPHHFVMVRYNPEEARRYIWYDLDETDDLKHRYNLDDRQCAHALYFPRGSDIREPRIVNIETITPAYIWDEFKVTVRIVNKDKEAIFVKFTGDGPRVDQTVVSAGRVVDVIVYRSYRAAAFRGRDMAFLQGLVLDDNVIGSDRTVTMYITGTAATDTYKEWTSQQETEEHRRSNTFQNWKREVGCIYLMTFKQPVLLPKFTHSLDGYKKAKMPKGIYDMLRTFYEDEGPRKNRSETADVECVINKRNIPTSIMFLPDAIIDRVSEMFLPVMEAWAGCPLEKTYLYGIREYHRGNTLRMHVDRVATHIISIILQVAQDLGEGGQPWVVQVIDFEGKRKNVTLQPGEMLLYESATLVHGRPFPLRGNTYANAFLHYKPRQAWPWSTTKRGDITNGTVTEVYDSLVSSNLDKFSSRKWNRNYNWRELQRRHVHTEL